MDERLKTGPGRLMPMLWTAAIGGAAAFAVSWLDPFGTGTEASATQGPAEVEAEDGPSVLVAMEPLVVSLSGTEGGRRRAPRLRVVVVIEADEAAAAGLSPDDARLRDGFTAAARGLGAEALSGAGGLESLRAAFLANARSILGEEAVSAVLVTDYVMS